MITDFVGYYGFEDVLGEDIWDLVTEILNKEESTEIRERIKKVYTEKGEFPLSGLNPSKVAQLREALVEYLGAIRNRNLWGANRTAMIELAIEFYVTLLSIEH